MASRGEQSKLPLVVIVGPTASGKTRLAIELAEKYEGEVVCADSRTVYKQMDIGTAKPSQAEQARVMHWGIDLVDPGETYTAADFKVYVDAKVEEIRARGKVPILVGGTGLYIDSVLFDYSFGPAPDVTFRKALESMTIEALYQYCIKNNITLPENNKNKRYVIRAIEQNGLIEKSYDTITDNVYVVGIATEKEVLKKRISMRAEQLFNDGVVDEAIMLGEKYGWENEAMTGNIYPLLRRHLQGELTVAEVIDSFTTLDWKLAKRQLTWFRRNPHILWLKNTEVLSHLELALANKL